MLRVNPSKIRVPEKDKNIWVVNGIPEELRPYGILFKKKNQKNINFGLCLFIKKTFIV